jgi:hypothetical protein
MTQYTGDMEPVILASGTEIAIGATTTYNLGTETSYAVTARLGTCAFYAVITSTVAITGGITVTYTERLYSVNVGTVKTATIPLSFVRTGVYHGIKLFANDYSGIILTSVKNDTTDVVSTYKVGLTGKIMY